MVASKSALVPGLMVSLAITPSMCFSLLLRPLFHKVLVFAVAYQFALLVVDGEPEDDHAASAASLELAHLEQRIEGIAAVDRLQEPRRLFEEADQRITDDMREDAATRRALDRHLQAMRQEVAPAARLAIFAVGVNRMIVAARRLEGGEQRLGLGARVDVKLLPDLQSLEPARR